MKPAGWSCAELHEVCTLITDGTHHSPENGPSGAFRYVTAKNIRKWGLDLSDITWVSAQVHEEIYARCPVQYEDVLYIKDGATTGLAVINSLREPFSLLSSVALLRADRKILDPGFLRYWLNSPGTVTIMTAGMTGSAIRRLVLRQIRSAELPLPPLSEQRRIADKLDATLARVGACRARLDLVPGILKRFRQAVLEAATSGRLTEDWRGEDGDAESPDWNFLRPPAAIPAGRYRRGSRSECDELPAKPCQDLPPSWRWRRVGDIADVKLGGTPSRSESRFWGGEIRWVSSGEVSNRRIHETAERITEAGLKGSNAKVNPAGTVLIAMIGEGKTRGQAALLEVEAATNQNVAALVLPPASANSVYVWFWALAAYANNRSAGRGGNQPALNGAKIRSLPIPLPPLDEQSEIVRRVEALFALADALEARYQAGRAVVDRLTPALLAKAFRGELVPQDPADEPAEALLARIRAERAAAPIAKPRRGRARSEGRVTPTPRGDRRR